MQTYNYYISCIENRKVRAQSCSATTTALKIRMFLVQEDETSGKLLCFITVLSSGISPNTHDAQTIYWNAKKQAQMKDWQRDKEHMWGLSVMCEAHLGVEWQQVQRETRARSCFSHSTGRLFNVPASSPHLPVRDSANKVNIVPQAAEQAFSLTRQRNLGAPAVPHPEMFFRKKKHTLIPGGVARLRPYLASKWTPMPQQGDVSFTKVSWKTKNRALLVRVWLITIPYRDYRGVERSIRVRSLFLSRTWKEGLH